MKKRQLQSAPWLGLAIVGIWVLLPSTQALAQESLLGALKAKADLLFENGFYEQAAQASQEIVDISQDSFGDDHPKTATAQNDLAYIYDAQGKYVAAESLYTKSIEIWVKNFGEKHLNVAIGLNNLGELYRSQNQLSKAESCYKKSLTIKTQLYGENHPGIATTLYNLGELYERQEKTSLAIRLFEKALNILDATKHNAAENKQLIILSLIEVYRDNGQKEKAIAMEQRLQPARKGAYSE